MNNKGISLVEVIVSLAILGIIVVCVCGFLEVGMNLSTSSTNRSAIEKEAQETKNQLADWIMETNKEIVVFKDTVEFDQAIVIYQSGSEAADNYAQVVYLKKEDQALYYHKITPKSGATLKEEDIIRDAETIGSGEGWEQFLLCEYVEDFKVDLTKLKQQMVKIELKLRYKGKIYQTEQAVSLRNKITVS